MTESILDKINLRASKLNTGILDVLRRAGVNESTWWRWKTGKASPTLKTLQRIEAVLDEIEAAA
jgi:transcriptional regulator with XRE-family HTH domain